MGSWENSRFIQVHEIIEREIMGEINQVVPNLIAESISGRKKSRWSVTEADIPAL